MQRRSFRNGYLTAVRYPVLCNPPGRDEGVDWKGELTQLGAGLFGAEAGQGRVQKINGGEVACLTSLQYLPT